MPFSQTSCPAPGSLEESGQSLPWGQVVQAGQQVPPVPSFPGGQRREILRWGLISSLSFMVPAPTTAGALFSLVILSYTRDALWVQARTVPRR